MLFADLKGFVPLAKTLGPERTVGLLNEMMRSFDRLAVAARGGEDQDHRRCLHGGGGRAGAGGRSRTEARPHGPRHAAGDGGAGGRLRRAAQPAHRHRLRPRDGRRHRRQAPHLRRVGRHGEPRLAPRRAEHAGPRAGGKCHQGAARWAVPAGAARRPRHQGARRGGGVVPGGGDNDVGSGGVRPLGQTPVRATAQVARNHGV